MLSERLQTTLHEENVPFSVNSLCNLGTWGFKQHFRGKNSGNSRKCCLNNICSGSLHNVYIRSFTSKKYKVITAVRVIPAAGQTFSRTLSKKVKLSASHANAMLLKPMQSWPTIYCVKCQDQRLHKQLTLNGTNRSESYPIVAIKVTPKSQSKLLILKI